MLCLDVCHETKDGIIHNSGVCEEKGLSIHSQHAKKVERDKKSRMLWQKKEKLELQQGQYLPT